MGVQGSKSEYESDFCVKYEDFNDIFRDRGPHGWRLREILRHAGKTDVATLVWERDGAGVVDHAMIQDPCRHETDFIHNKKLGVWACSACGAPMDRCLDEMQAKP